MVRLSVSNQLAGDSRSVQWWHKLHWLAHEQARQDKLRYYESVLMRASMLTLTPNITTESKDAQHKLVMSAHQHILRSLFPWQNDKINEQSQQSTDAKLAASWKRLYGDPNDPIVQQRIDATVSMLTQQDRGRKQRQMAR